MKRTITIIPFLLLFVGLPLFAQIGSRVLINGYSSFEFEKQFGDEGEGDPNGSFDADLFDLVINVFATDRLRIASDFSWEHGAATEDGRGNVVLEYGFGEYSVNSNFKVRAGKMFTHFGIYNEIHTAKPAFLTVKEPQSTNKNHKFGSDNEGRFYPRWLTGLAVLGNSTLGENVDFDYIFQISNGEQENTNPYEEDDNKQKALSGRLRFYPTRSLQVGASFYTDQHTLFDSTGADAGDRGRLTSIGAHAELDFSTFGLEVEFVTGSIETAVGQSVSRNGFTAMVYAPVQEIVMPYFRFEYLDPNQDITADEAQMFVYGLNFQIDDGLFLKTEMNTVSSAANNARFAKINYSEFKAAIAIGF